MVNKLGFAIKLKNNQMTSEDWEKFSTAFETEHGVNLQQAIKDSKKVAELEATEKQTLIELLSIVDEDNTDNAKPTPEATSKKEVKTDAAPEAPLAASILDEVKKVKTALVDAQAKIKKLEGEPEEKGGKKVEMKKPEKVVIAGFGHTKEHLFGIPADMYLMSKPWNEITATGQPRRSWSKDEKKAFRNEFDNYGESIANRINHLHSMGLLGTLRKDASSVDYSGFDSTGWGQEYVIRRQDALISYIKALPTVADIFPVRYNVQNKMIMTNSFLTDFSQSYQSGKIYKGSFTMVPEEAIVHDAMFKHLFENLKTLEKEYIGYLNREGSDPIKWNFIEWLMVETLKKLHNEQEARRILGVRIEPITGTAGHFMFASDGVLRRLQSYVDAFKLNPFTDLNTYTSSTILAYVESLAEKVNQILPNLRGWKLYMNEKHLPWYLADFRTTYGTDMDFKGGEITVRNYGLDAIVPVPNMGNSCMMWVTMPGNIELYEDLPGEMEKMYFERELESLIVASWWKEGVGAYMTGKKFTTLALLQADLRKNMWIFVNDPVTALIAGATTADGSVNTRFKTINNSGATAITDITNAEEGVVYRITCGGVTNATTIAKASKFSELSAAWIPTAVGDYLEVYWNSTTSKFVEVTNIITA
jgi:hypothetical protein